MPVDRAEFVTVARELAPARLRSSWTVNHEVTLQMKVDNLLDKAYTRALYEHDGNPYGYREEGRALMFGVTWMPQL